jgi:hypothetical protein
MVEISMSGSGEGPVWVTGRGYSTMAERMNQRSIDGIL